MPGSSHRGSGRRSGGEPADDADQVVTAVLTASRVLVSVSARSLAAVEDTVTVAQFRALVVLERQGQVNLNGLAESLGVRASTAMRTVDRMVTAGLVRRRENPSSRREVVLDLTEEGQHVVLAVTGARRAEIARILRELTPRRRSDLLAAFRAFTDAAGEPAANGSANAPLGW